MITPVEWMMEWLPQGGAWSGYSTLASLGFFDPVIEEKSQIASTLNLTLSGAAVDEAYLLPYKSMVILQRNGVTFFYGVVTKTPSTGDAKSENQDYEISDPWWFLENQTYQQQWQNPTTGVNFAANVFQSGGVIDYVQVTNGGTGYPQNGIVQFADPTGSGAYGYMNTNAAGSVVSVSVINGGNNYSAPSIFTVSTPNRYRSHVFLNPWILSSPGTGFVGTCHVSGTSITGVTVVSGGKGYPQNAAIQFTDATGSEAYGYATTDTSGAITAITMSSGGVNYTAPSAYVASGFYYARETTQWQINDAVVTFFAYVATLASNKLPIFPGNTNGTLPITLGSIPSDCIIDIPLEECRDMTCAEVLRRQLKWMPDSVQWFDHSTASETTFPTLHLGRRGNNPAGGSDLASVSMPLSGATIGGAKLNGIEIDPRYDLMHPSVALEWEQNNSVSGADSYTQLSLFKTIYPPSATGFENTGLVCTVELQGYNQNNVSAALTVGNFSSSLGPGGIGADISSDPWWQSKVPWLANVLPVSSGGRGATLQTLTIVDAGGNSYATPPLGNELLQGQIAPWMRITTGGGSTPVYSDQIQIQATIEATMNNPASGQSGLVPNSGPIAKSGQQTVSFLCVCTNAPANAPAQSNFQTWGSFEIPEAVPTSLAQTIWEGISFLPYEGSITFTEQECSGIVRVGNLLNITGATGSAGAPWSTMYAVVQSVRMNFQTGTTQVRFGPPKHLGAADLITLLRLNRFRVVYMNPAAQLSAQAAVNGQTQLGNSLPKSDTTSGDSGTSQIGVLANWVAGSPVGGLVGATIPLSGGAPSDAAQGNSQARGSSLALWMIPGGTGFVAGTLTISGGGGISAVAVGAGGQNYQAGAPVVATQTGGSGFSGTVGTVSSTGAVTSITVGTQGTGYTGAASITIPPPSDPTVQAPTSSSAALPRGQIDSSGKLLSLLAALADTLGSDGKYHSMSIQEVSICVNVMGTPTTMSIMALCSAPFTPG